MNTSASPASSRPQNSPSPSLPVSESPRLQPRPLTAGTHLARCSAIIDLGSHAEPAFNHGKPSPTTANHSKLGSKRKLLLTFTLFAQDGSTQRVSRQFTHSCDVRSSLSKFLTPWLCATWKGEHGIKVSAIAEMPCLIVLQASAALNPRTGLPYLNITSASPLIAGLEVPDLKWPASIFSLKAPNRETFQALPAWIQTKIRSSSEWQSLTAKQGSTGTPASRAMPAKA